VDAPRRRTRSFVVLAGLSYLVFAVILWWGAWSQGASTHTLCGCGDPALFLWFFQWPATAVAHLHNPLYSTALFHPGGVNLLAQTSVLGLSVPLMPVTWLFGPVASLNVASTLAPTLSAFAAFMVLRRRVRWMPAAYLGGLLYGFSPSVLTSLQFSHLMTAAIMLLPLILATLDEILVRQQHSPVKAGLLLGLLLFFQFFLSSEMLAVVAVLFVVCIAALLLHGVVADRARLRLIVPHAARGLVVSGVVGAVLLIYPVWFALLGPAHLSGLIWPNIGSIGGYDGASFISANLIHHVNLYTAIGGYEGSQLPSSAYLGWGLLGVALAGLFLFIRDRRLWFYAFLLAVCVGCSWGTRPGELVPERLFHQIPVIENVIEQRFMIIGFLAAAFLLAMIVDHIRWRVPALWKKAGRWSGLLGAGAALGVAAVALVPIGATFASSMPFVMRPVTLPRWYVSVAPHLPPDRVLLNYPAPFSGIQVAMAWQAVDAMHFSQAGGGGPQGVSYRAGAAEPGFKALEDLAFGITIPQPTGTRAESAAVRRAISVWKVNTVVIAPEKGTGLTLQGHDPTYAAAFMTAVLGRLPRIQAGAWVWDNVSVDRAGDPPPLRVAPTLIARCVKADEKVVAAQVATLRVARCMKASAHR
jgi:dolichyl-phosphate beta-glucosyltransferase